MDKFNTHGGYFAPQGLLKINEGGKHDENPNGGVQLGVDQQGIPNLVEEGEVVYKDFVYSDNIKAKKDILEQFNIPSKFADKLYSDIANAYCDDAEEQTDPITINGLNVMLGRLAEAQEEQKRQEEEAALIEELKNMSPEELDALEQAMMQEAAAQEEQVIPEEQIQPEVAPEMVAPEQVAPEVPMMANGGNLYRMGGNDRKQQRMFDAVTEQLRNSGTNNGIQIDPETGAKYELPLETEEPLMNAALVATQPGSIVTKALAPAAYKGLINAAGSGDISEALLLNLLPVKNGKVSQSLTRGLSGKADDWINYIEKWESELEAAGREADRTVRTGKQAAAKANIRLGEQEYKRAVRNNGQGKSVAAEAPKTTVDKLTQSEINKDAKTANTNKDIARFIKRNLWWEIPMTADAIFEATPTGGLVRNAIDAWNNRSYSGPNVQPYDLSEAVPYRGYACGGKVNRYDWGSFMDTLNKYEVSRNPGGIAGRYKIDTSFPLNGYKDIAALENSDNYKAFTNFVLANPTNQNVLDYLKALDAGTNANVSKLFDKDGNLREGWDKLYADRRTDKLGGIYHFSPEELPDWMRRPLETIPVVENPLSQDQQLAIDAPMLFRNPNTGLVKSEPDVVSGVGEGDVVGPVSRTPFDTRLLSPLMDAAMGLANLATPADHYDFKPIRPYLPYGRIRQQYERYNPIDQNLVTNQMRAQANANMRALRNAGLGPSLGANLLAADYNANQNLGSALTNVWDANNQRYNQVIQQNNAADAAIANYDWQVEAARANALNQFLPYNQRMALTVDQMNNEAEQDKYNAIAASLNSTKKFLNDYGWERMNRNMVNTNRGNMGYMIDEANRVYYDPSTGQYYRYGCGGTLLKNHKK